MNARNLWTNSVSPQFHVVFDDLFQTIFCSGENDTVVDAICNYLFESNWDVYAEDELGVDVLEYGNLDLKGIRNCNLIPNQKVKAPNNSTWNQHVRSHGVLMTRKNQKEAGVKTRALG